MEQIIAGLEKLAILWQKGLDNLRDRPWMVFLSIAIAWGGCGWYLFVAEAKDHKADGKAATEINKAATDKTIEAQQKTIEAKEKLIEQLSQKRIDTTSK